MIETRLVERVIWLRCRMNNWLDCGVPAFSGLSRECIPYKMIHHSIVKYRRSTFLFCILVFTMIDAVCVDSLQGIFDLIHPPRGFGGRVAGRGLNR